MELEIDEVEDLIQQIYGAGSDEQIDSLYEKLFEHVQKRREAQQRSKQREVQTTVS